MEASQKETLTAENLKFLKFHYKMLAVVKFQVN